MCQRDLEDARVRFADTQCRVVQQKVRLHREQKLTAFENFFKELVTDGALEGVTKSHQKALAWLTQQKLETIFFNFHQPKSMSIHIGNRAK